MNEIKSPQPVSPMRLLSSCVAAAVPAGAGFAGVWYLATLAAGDFMKHFSWAALRWEGAACAVLFFAVFSYDLLRRYRVARAADWKKNMRFGACWKQACDIMDENVGTYALFILIGLFWLVAGIGFILFLAAMLIGIAGFGFGGVAGMLPMVLQYVSAVVLLPPIAFGYLPRIAPAIAIFLALRAK